MKTDKCVPQQKYRPENVRFAKPLNFSLVVAAKAVNVAEYCYYYGFVPQCHRNQESATVFCFFILTEDQKDHTTNNRTLVLPKVVVCTCMVSRVLLNVLAIWWLYTLRYPGRSTLLYY